MIAQLCGRLVELVVSTVIFITTFRDHDEEIRRSTQYKTALHNFKVTAYQKAKRFLDQVHEITLHCRSKSSMMTAAKTGINSRFNVLVQIERPDFAPLNDIINHWAEHMSMARSCYKEFEDDCGVVITSCTQAAEICRYKAKEATDRKVVGKVFGGAAVVASIAVCAVGALTSGFGLVVVASVIAGVGAATAAVYHVLEMEQSDKAFSSIGMQVDSLLDASRDMKEKVGHVERNLQRVSVLLDNLVHRRNNHKSTSSIQDTLNDLGKIGSQAHQTIPNCRRCLESTVNNLR